MCTKSREPLLTLSAAEAGDLSTETAAEALVNETGEITNAVIRHAGDCVLMRTGTVALGIAKKWDPRLACARITITRSPSATLQIPQGTIVIYFDSTASCLDTVGVRRSGTLLVNYVGRRYAAGSSRTTTCQQYRYNGIAISGTCRMTNLTDSTTKPFLFTQDFTAGLVRYAAGTTVTRTQRWTAQWNKAAVAPGDTVGHYLAGGTANGVIKDSVMYQTVVNEDLISTYPCSTAASRIAVTGSKTWRIGNNGFYIDYGAGTCDNDVTVTYNGKSKTVTINQTGN